MSELITNGTEIKQRIISEISSAKQCIYLAMAYFTDREIAMAIVDAKNRSVTVDIILSSNIQNETVKLMLKGAAVGVHAFETGDARGIMHHKFCLIDNKISINGSYNYSLNASNNNVENIQVSDDIAIYSQFLSEFERLKFNIDNRIAVNESILIPESKMEQVKPLNLIDVFSQQLHNLVYSAAQIDTVKYKENGFKNSEDNKGSLDIFRTEYKCIKERIKTYATDEGLGNIKNILTSNISIAYESAKTNVDLEKQEKIVVEKRNNELEKRQILDKTNELKQEKSILESGNQSTGDKGLLQINKEIEKNKLERRNLEQSFIIKRFWSLETIFITLGLGVLVFYLSMFFSSAIYKVFYEGNLIRASMEAGITPGSPELVDTNAIVKIFRQQGSSAGFFAALFFLIPVLLSNLAILGSKDKRVNGLAFWVGIIIFDILVSTMVAFNIDEMKSLLIGQESTLDIFEVIFLGEFWLIFLFGMIPLIITHFLITNITNAYKGSQREIVDAEKNRKIQSLDTEMIDLASDKEDLINRVKEKDDALSENKGSTLNLEIEMNSIHTQIENHYAELQRQIKAIYDDFNARIMSGIIFTDVILDSVITAYKSGFIEFLPRFYAADEVARRVQEIELATETTI